MPRPTTSQQLRAIRQAITALRRDLRRVAAMLQKSGKSAPRRRLKLSPQRRTQLRLHGRYLGHIRQLKPTQKVKVKAVKAKSGYRAAIALAKRMAAGAGR